MSADGQWLLNHASGMHTPDSAAVGRSTNTQGAPPAMFENQTFGTYAGLTEVDSGSRESQDAFSWPAAIPDIWDQVSLFRGPFDGGDLEGHATGPG